MGAQLWQLAQIFQPDVQGFDQLLDLCPPRIQTHRSKRQMPHTNNSNRCVCARCVCGRCVRVCVLIVQCSIGTGFEGGAYFFVRLGFAVDLPLRRVVPFNETCDSHNAIPPLPVCGAQMHHECMALPGRQTTCTRCAFTLIWSPGRAMEIAALTSRSRSWLLQCPAL